ncbi:MAG: ATP-binding cassette domain-containing protein [Candidatus Nealsonbacteria bacterium DGGOD1a]|jgi:cell division transport system ATP-binding protein|nr:MAG: ATP-binding cassette domain-containing protein [Candidatus Nealsonbacteria bacterium DGGOD1a]
MIKFNDITKVYDSRTAGANNIVALDGVSFGIMPGEFVSVVGRSGAGKTTLFKLMLVEEKPTNGSILFKDQNIYKLKQGNLNGLRRSIGAVFQDYKLLPNMTVRDNIAYVMKVIGASDTEIRRDVPRILEIVELSDREKNFPAELSGGERQRVAIARALIHRPEVVLADEPTGNLDPYHTLDILKLLLKINEMGTTVVLATHNREIVNKLKRRVVTLEKGKVIRDEEKGRFAL